MNLKIFVYVLVYFSFISCNESVKENTFCTATSGWDYNRIPLLGNTELTRLNGNENWIFSLEKNKIDSPNISALINVKIIGINENSFVLVSEVIKYNDINFEGIAIKVNINGRKKTVTTFKNILSIDSVYADKVNFRWYNTDQVWEIFNNTSTVPWCSNLTNYNTE